MAHAGWHALHKGAVNYRGHRIVLPIAWWVVSSRDDYLLCMRLPSEKGGPIAASIMHGRPIHMQEGLPVSAPTMEVDRRILTRVDSSVEKSILGKDAIYLLTYQVMAPLKEVDRIYYFWVVPAKQLSIVVSNVSPSQKAHGLELVKAVIHAFNS